MSLVPSGVLLPVKDAAVQLVAAAEHAGHPVITVYGYRSKPDHNNKKCVDFMITDRTAGEWLYDYAWHHREALEVNLIIWWGTITRIYAHWPWKAGRRVLYTGTTNRHHDHLHIEFTGRPLAPSGGYLGPYEVDPKKVSTFLWSRGPAWENRTKRAPGYRVTTGVRIVSHAGRQYLETEAGNRYALEYLRRVT